MDVRATVTDAFIRLLERELAGEGRLWDGVGALGLPTNFKTKTAYTGINIPLLWASARERDLCSNEWLTFNQAKSLGATVRKGAKGVLAVFFSRGSAPRDKDGSVPPAATPVTTAAAVPILKPFWLFNVADIDGLALTPAPERSSFQPMQVAEALLAATGATIKWGRAGACYVPALDEIRMPARERFIHPVNAYACALHELSHWTGHISRLDRDLRGRFGSEAYAMEELIAELGSAFLVAHLGLAGARMEHHASYVQSWLKVLKNDRRAVFAASAHAHAAYRFILEKAGLPLAQAV